MILENSCHTPDWLVGEPACVTLVEAILKSSRELFGCSDGSASSATCLHSSRKLQSVAAAVSSVVEHHTLRENRNHQESTHTVPVMCEGQDAFAVVLYSHFKFFFSQYPQCYSLNTHDSWIMWHSYSGFICLFFKEGILQYPWHGEDVWITHSTMVPNWPSCTKLTQNFEVNWFLAGLCNFCWKSHFEQKSQWQDHGMLKWKS